LLAKLDVFQKNYCFLRISYGLRDDQLAKITQKFDLMRDLLNFSCLTCPQGWWGFSQVGKVLSFSPAFGVALVSVILSPFGHSARGAVRPNS
jgi:hypothetical protein